MNQAHVETSVETGGLVGRLFATGRNVWLAGLGVVAEAEAGSRELFSHLVEKGRPIEEKRRQTIEAVTGRANQTAKELVTLVQDTVEYESRQMLKRLNVMTRDDVKVFSARLKTLTAKIDEYAAKRLVEESEVVKIVTPENETAAVVVKATRPRKKKTTTTTKK